MKQIRSRCACSVWLLALTLTTGTISARLIAQASTPQKAAARGGAAPQADVNGFRVGDRVQINTGFGWIEGTILSASGNNYRVRSQTGIEVTKTFPSELRRIGPATSGDKAAGQYRLHDKVQVNVNGVWMNGEIITTMGMDYQVQLSGNRTVWANPQTLRPSAFAAPPLAPKSGTPPRQGLTSCAGKVEGRYATTGGFATQTIVFRSGKAIMKDAVGDNDVELECWMGGGKVYLHKPGDSFKQDMPIDINDDGTLQTPFGEMKKKGS
jgi:hypothetical protein